MTRVPTSPAFPESNLTSLCSAAKEAFPQHREGSVKSPGEGGVLGWHGYLLGALSRLALALVVQDALDQMVILIQHLEGGKQDTCQSHSSWFTSGHQDPWGECWGHSLQVPGPYLESAMDPQITTSQEGRGSLHLCS